MSKIIAKLIADTIFVAFCYFTFAFLLSIHDILAFVFAFFILVIIAASP